jgi:MscS family membrane protein
MRAALRPLLLGVAFAGFLLPRAAVSQRLPDPAPATAGAPDALGDPYRRETPYGAFFGYVRAAHRDNWALAGEYLQWPKSGKTSREEMARELKAVLDQCFSGDLEKLSRSPVGDLNDGLTAELERVGQIESEDEAFDLLLVRTTTPDKGPPIWLVSSQSLREIPAVWKRLTAPTIDQSMPAVLRQPVGGLQLWQLIAFLLLIPVLYAASRLLVGAAFGLLDRVLQGRSQWIRVRTGVGNFRPPVALLLALALHSLCVSRLGLPLLNRYGYGRLLTLAFILAGAWLFLRLVDLFSLRTTMNLLAAGATPTSSLTIARRMLRGAVFAAAVLFALASFGVNLTATLTGLGIGGVALAFAAQKSLENLFGGFVVLTDKILRVGDTVRIGTAVGDIEDVTLYATRLRATDRSVVTIPNGTLITAQIENRSRRDKFFFNPTLCLVYETTLVQMRVVLETARARLESDSRVERGTMRVRFVRINAYSLDVEVFAYLLVPDTLAFLAFQEELLLMLLDVVERAGTSLALPAQTTYVAGTSEHPLAARPSRPEPTS